MKDAIHTPFARALRRAFYVFLAMGLLGFVALGIVNWEREVKDTRRSLSVYAAFLASASQAFFDDLGHGLQPLGQLLQRMDVLNHPEMSRPDLLKFQKRYPQIGSMAVIAPNGKMLINTASRPGTPLPDFRKTTAYMAPFKRALNADTPYTIGRPEYGQVLHEWRFPFRFTLRDDQGRPLFMIQAAIPLETGMRMLRKMSLPAHSLVGILRDDGLQQARWPVDKPNKVYGRNLHGPLVRMVLAHPGINAGFFTGHSPWMFTEQERLGAFTHLSRLPLYAYVSIPYSYIRSKWWEHNSPVVAVFLVFMYLFGAVAYWVTRQERQHSRELIELARSDSLTGLANRAGAEELLERKIQECKMSGQHFSIIFFDLDRFKDINDSLGHGIGDQLLVAVGQRTKAVLRKDDIFARIGGDEFLIILSGSQADASTVSAKRIIDAFEAPFIVSQQRLKMSCSIGIAIYPEHGTDRVTLLKHADTAMYEAKRQGRSGFAWYEWALGARLQQRIDMESRMRDALAQKQYQLYYQPIIDLRTGDLIGIEALLRWLDTDGNSHSPEDFIPVAEETGLILPLGEWVLNEACAQTRKWLDRGYELGISVNLSTRQFLDPDLPKKVETVLSENNLPASRLELEITEGAAMLDPDSSVEVLTTLKKIGVKIAIDDFGTGYSSLSYLKRIPADTIKIDKSFVDGVADESDDHAIVYSIIALSRALNKMTIAEGIETQEQKETLEEAGCRWGQGFLFSHPLPAEKFEEMLESKRAQIRYSCLDD